MKTLAAKPVFTGQKKVAMAAWDDVIDFDNVGEWPMELSGWPKLFQSTADEERRSQIVPLEVDEHVVVRHQSIASRSGGCQVESGRLKNMRACRTESAAMAASFTKSSPLSETSRQWTS